MSGWWLHGTSDHRDPAIRRLCRDEVRWVQHRHSWPSRLQFGDFLLTRVIKRADAVCDAQLGPFDGIFDPAVWEAIRTFEGLGLDWLDALYAFVETTEQWAVRFDRQGPAGRAVRCVLKGPKSGRQDSPYQNDSLGLAVAFRNETTHCFAGLPISIRISRTAGGGANPSVRLDPLQYGKRYGTQGAAVELATWVRRGRSLDMRAFVAEVTDYCRHVHAAVLVGAEPVLSKHFEHVEALRATAQNAGATEPYVAHSYGRELPWTEERIYLSQLVVDANAFGREIAVAHARIGAGQAPQPTPSTRSKDAA